MDPSNKPEESPAAADKAVTYQEPRRATLMFIFVTVLLDVLSLGVMIPVLPKLIENEFLGGDTARAATITGIFAMVWALMQFLFSPLLGALSDQFGRRKVILISCFGLGLDYILMALAPNLTWLFIGRVLSGITAASFATAGAYIADVTPPEKRAASYGLFGAAWGIGFVVGPALGGMLGEYGLRLPLWVAAGLTICNAAYGYFILPESLPLHNRSKFSWARANPLGSLRLMQSHPELLGWCVVDLSAGPPSFPERVCVVCGASLRLGTADGRLYAHGGGHRQRRHARLCRSPHGTHSERVEDALYCVDVWDARLWCLWICL